MNSLMKPADGFDGKRDINYQSVNKLERPRIPADDLYGETSTKSHSELVFDSNGDHVLVIYGDTQLTEAANRGTWGGKIEFLLTCIGFAVGLGNVWRFPYLAHKNGGGAFLIPYTLCLVFIGLPLFFLEFAFGQFASLGPISIWSISPLFKGVGYAMTIISFYLSIYYNVIVSHCFFYFFASMNSELPWISCDNVWNNKNACQPAAGPNKSFLNVGNGTKILSSTEEYYYNYVLEMSESIDDYGLPSWKLTLCLLACWIICLIVLLKGVQSLGKVAYFTAIFPYVILTILLINGCFLKGSWNGIKYYITPQFDRLLDPRVWTDAATQIFFSLSCCNGGLITMSSYNKFKNDCCRDAVLVAVINCATSVYAGFVIFASLGYMAAVKNVNVSDVAKGGPGLAFVVYPEALAQMPIAPFWSVLFFLMFLVLGFGSQFSIVETILSGVQDELRMFGLLQSKLHIIAFRVAVCFVCFLLGLSMTCRGGMYFLNLLDWTVSGFPLLVVALCELFVICRLYGMPQFERDIEQMIKYKPNWYWRITWCFISPFLIIALLVFFFIKQSDLEYDKKEYPKWAVIFAYSIASVPMLCILGIFLWRYCRGGGFLVLAELVKPKSRWGPADKVHREEFLELIVSTSSKKGLGQIDGSSTGLVECSLAVATKSTVSELNTLGADVNLADNFFQSKTSLAEKFYRVASKEKDMSQMLVTGSNSRLCPNLNVENNATQFGSMNSTAFQEAAKNYVENTKGKDGPQS